MLKKYTSVGFIPYKIIKKKTYYLLVKKKMSYAFGDFISGFYRTYKDVLNLFNNMTKNEINNIIQCTSLEELIGRLGITDRFNFSVKNLNQFRSFKKKMSIQFFENLNYQRIGRNKLPWEFPKGRKRGSEKIIETAIRELKEETGIDREMIRIEQSVEDLRTIKIVGEENRREYTDIFIGCEIIVEDYKKMVDEFIPNNEIEKIKWVEEVKIFKKISPYYEKIISKFLTRNV